MPAVPNLPDHVNETIDSIAEMHARAERDADPHQRFVERATRLIGRPATVYIGGVLILGWIGLNLTLAALHRPQIDPFPFFDLQGAVTLAALLMTILILTTENRLSRIEEQRSRLTLQIALLADHRVAKVIEMLEAMRRDDPSLPNVNDPAVSEMTRPTDPNEVLEVLEETANAKVEESGLT